MKGWKEKDIVLKTLSKWSLGFLKLEVINKMTISYLQYFKYLHRTEYAKIQIWGKLLFIYHSSYSSSILKYIPEYSAHRFEKNARLDTLGEGKAGSIPKLLGRSDISNKHSLILSLGSTMNSNLTE